MSQTNRRVFFVSDRTGITAETLGNSLLTQFDGVDFQSLTFPFVNTDDKASSVVAYIDHAAREDGVRPIVFSTTVTDVVRAKLREANALFLDL
ncbi:kinase/pyrophosphorylase, partial [uncultured Abyssibacter sp.]|uniref:kinase/pyrophosphorylase n=1 Tax=uncultured Abyssibacter sp. TaxID=2320202 RepID=UPI0032B14559